MRENCSQIFKLNDHIGELDSQQSLAEEEQEVVDEMKSEPD